MTIDTAIATEPTGLADVKDVSAYIKRSVPSIWRDNTDGTMPPALKIQRSVRWRWRTGDARTGILDWIEAGCPHCGPATADEGGSHE